MGVPGQTGPARTRRVRAAGIRSTAVRAPFVVRWVVAVGTSMLLGAGVEYAIASHQVEQRALEAAAADYAADLSGLELVLAADLPPDARRIAARAQLQGVLATHGTEYVALLDADGGALGVAGGRSSTPDVEEVAAVAASGRAVQRAERDADADAAADRGAHRYEFLLPVRSPDGTLVVEIDQQADVIAGLLADLRARKALGLLLGLLVAVPASYLLGGRALHRRQRRAEHTADTDALTGLPSRRPFGPALDAALARPGGRAVVLALVDLDDFKQVNDRLGHSHGDTVLRALADSFGALRSSDTAFRVGGDEFAVLLTGGTEAQAEEALARVRRTLARLAPGVTFSAGVAAAPDDVSAAELWERADTALYEAKARGRRCTVRFGAMAISGTVGALLRLPAGSPVDGPQEAFTLAQRLGLPADPPLALAAT